MRGCAGGMQNNGKKALFIMGGNVKISKLRFFLTKIGPNQFIFHPYGRSRHDCYINKKLGSFALLYFHNVNYTTRLYFFY